MIRHSILPYLGFLLHWGAGIPGVAAGAEGRFSPYAADFHTLHLWHLDEPGPPFADAGFQAMDLRGMHNGAEPGLASLPGLGRAVSLRHQSGGTPGRSDLRGAVLTLDAALMKGEGTGLGEVFRYAGGDGAFTMELAFRLDVLPREAQVIALGLISMDGDRNDRIFNFRIEKSGFLAFIPLPNGEVRGGGLATIPLTGPHALKTGSWFHAAVTYDGMAGVTNNLKLYWTRLEGNLPRANLIGQGTLSNDFNGHTGALAVGNEARGFPGNAQAEPFPGLIDEVRMSSVARDATDFFFVTPSRRRSPEQAASAVADPGRWTAPDLRLAAWQVDGVVRPLPVDGETGGLKLESGLHRLDFDFGIHPGPADGTVQIRYQFEGIDERWQESGLGMGLNCLALDAQGRILSQTQFPALGRSEGWETTLEDSTLTPRREPLFIPPGTVSVRLVLSSGSPDTTGSFAIDDIKLAAPGGEGAGLWKNGGLTDAANEDSPAGVPLGWQRSGTDAAIARRVFCRGNRAAGLVDGDQAHHGEWAAEQTLPAGPWDGRTLVLSWAETYNVIGGTLHRASYVNVPPGHYTFRAIALAGEGAMAGEGLALPVVIQPPYWDQLWFWPAIAAGGVGVFSVGVITAQRRRARRRLERLHFQHGIERDRTRIARDMHDDLGTRVTVLNMTASLALRELERDPDKTRRHLVRMNESSRDLVVAMDDLVWAVNPAHDTLDHLASHLTRLAGEMFADSAVRCRLDIPAEFPARPLGAEFRHHLSLAVKEALHNILQHAGPCGAEVSLALHGDELQVMVTDTGKGFDPAAAASGNGQANLRSRAAEIGACCEITSAPGQGTTVRFLCRLPEIPC